MNSKLERLKYLTDGGKLTRYPPEIIKKFCESPTPEDGEIILLEHDVKKISDSILVATHVPKSYLHWISNLTSMLNQKK